MVARVQGTRARPYRVEARLELGADGSVETLTGWCACPVGHRCKHLAAVTRLLLAETLPERPARASADEYLEWAHRLVADGTAANAPATKRPSRRLLFVVDPEDDEGVPPMVHPTAVSLTRQGYGRERSVDLDADPRQARGWIAPEDRLLYTELRLRERQAFGYGHLAPRLPPDETGPALLQRLVETERCHLRSPQGPALSWGPPHPASVGWRIDHRGVQRPRFEGLPKGVLLLGLRPPCFVDPSSGACGLVESGLSPAVAQSLLHAPPLSPEAAAELDPSRWPADAELPPPRRLSFAMGPRTSPRGHLNLRTEGDRSYARLTFRYGEAITDPDDPEPLASGIRDATVVVQAPRDRGGELSLTARMFEAGLVDRSTEAVDHEGRWPSRWEAPDDEAWLAFVGEGAELLRDEGWLVEIDDDFAWDLTAVDGWFLETEEQPSGDWFALSLGVEVDGERVSILPAVTRVLAHGRPIPAHGVVLELPGRRRVRVPKARLSSIVSVLLELFGNRPLDADGRLLLPRADAGRLVELDPTQDLRWLGPTRLHGLAKQIGEGIGSEPVVPPPGLRVELRDYQRTGLAWLQGLRSLAVGGVLADDMGLGKTVQTLAHLLVEQDAGRLDRPCLVVAPTSVLPVWMEQAGRFAPSLRTLLYHGPQRARAVGDIAAHDVVVTSYAIALRDVDLLAEVPLHLLVLDEAHAIKNSSAKITRAVRRLVARTRLCLSGTPMENDLTELWSQLDFLNPGLLGTPRRFQQLFAGPVSEGDTERAHLLSRRIAPFVLRRTKEDVLPELPPKTELIRYADLGREQRDVYEAVRLGAESEVRSAIERQGLARTQIGVFEALLKLREACCDPRLLPFEQAKRSTSSAKLELLMQLLTEEMLPAGRRVLVFSQFTRMLSLIGEALDARGIEWLKLTGRTRKRQEVVERFTHGDAPVFLVSLKAGGVGLNLTAADTVVLYDPWWNPAAEDQAADRTHRIGQTRPVLVCKLVARGTVEERMLELQARKRRLADAVLDPAARRGSTGRLSLSEHEVEALLAPLS